MLWKHYSLGVQLTLLSRAAEFNSRVSSDFNDTCTTVHATVRPCFKGYFYSTYHFYLLSKHHDNSLEKTDLCLYYSHCLLVFLQTGVNIWTGVSYDGVKHTLLKPSEMSEQVKTKVGDYPPDIVTGEAIQRSSFVALCPDILLPGWLYTGVWNVMWNVIYPWQNREEEEETNTWCSWTPWAMKWFDFCYDKLVDNHTNRGDILLFSHQSASERRVNLKTLYRQFEDCWQHQWAGSLRML